MEMGYLYSDFRVVDGCYDDALNTNPETVLAAMYETVKERG